MRDHPKNLTLKAGSSRHQFPAFTTEAVYPNRENPSDKIPLPKNNSKWPIILNSDVGLENMRFT